MITDAGRLEALGLAQSKLATPVIMGHALTGQGILTGRSTGRKSVVELNMHLSPLWVTPTETTSGGS